MDSVALPAAATTEAATGSGTTEAAKKRIHNREIEAKGTRGFLKKFFDKFVTKTVFKKIICVGMRHSRPNDGFFVHIAHSLTIGSFIPSS